MALLKKKEFPLQFTLEELTKSSTAKRLGISNVPTGQVLDNLKTTANKLVEVKEHLYGYPVIVSSGYRSPEVNKHIPGSSNTSAHTLGWAADITCPGYGTPYRVAAKLADCGLKFDQVIYEYGSWVHISFDPRMRQQVLTIDKSGTRSGLHL